MGQFWMYLLPTLISSYSQRLTDVKQASTQRRVWWWGFYVVYAGFQSAKSMTQQWGGGGGGNGFWHLDHWADVLPCAGKTKGRIQVDEWVTMVLRAQCHYHHHPSSFWPLWGHLTLRGKVIGSTLQMFHYSTFLTMNTAEDSAVGSLTHTEAHTFGFQDLDCLLSSLRALVYSAWILLAGTTRSPSDFVTTTKSALSMIPLLMPWIKIRRRCQCCTADYIKYI